MMPTHSRHWLGLGISCALLAGCASSPSAPMRNLAQQPHTPHPPQRSIASQQTLSDALAAINPPSSTVNVDGLEHHAELTVSSPSPRERTQHYRPLRGDKAYHAQGVASWYGKRFHGRKTASGERFNMHDLTAAHLTLPLGSLLHVTNMRNGKSIVVKVNDRGPYHKGRLLDLSRAAAERLGFLDQGNTPVKLVRVFKSDLAPTRREQTTAQAPSSAPDVFHLAPSITTVVSTHPTLRQPLSERPLHTALPYSRHPDFAPDSLLNKRRFDPFLVTSRARNLAQSLGILTVKTLH